MEQAARDTDRELNDESETRRLHFVEGFVRIDRDHRAILGAIARHSASFRSVWYSLTGRLCCYRVFGAHRAKSQLAQFNRHGRRNRFRNYP
jgi:hypothetical protein